VIFRMPTGEIDVMLSVRRAILFTLTAAVCPLHAMAGPEEPFLGRWALTIPGGSAGWLGVTNEQGFLDASILWGGGSVVPCESAYLDGDTLVVTRVREVERKSADGTVVRKQQFTETIVVKVDETTYRRRKSSRRKTARAWTGTRLRAGEFAVAAGAGLVEGEVRRADHSVQWIGPRWMEIDEFVHDERMAGGKQ
jgi:hypothetical protein